MRPASVCGAIRSAVYLARPDTFSGPSTIGTWVPMLCMGAISFMGECRRAQKRSALRRCARQSAQCGFAFCALRHSPMNEIAPMHSIGTHVPMVDGPEKVSGRAKYTADLIAPQTLAGRICRSPYAHAEIVEVDTSEA